ncbi:MAG: hypothetical protein JNK31_03740 [Candidatus Competibacter sp.]|nr:hypothetical protein [Candidatus Competibacter sp.]
MRYRALQNQRARHALTQAAVKRSQRRCDLIRVTAEEEPSPLPALKIGLNDATDEPESLATLS